MINSDVANAAESAEERQTFWQELLPWLDEGLKASLRCPSSLAVGSTAGHEVTIPDTTIRVETTEY